MRQIRLPLLLILLACSNGPIAAQDDGWAIQGQVTTMLGGAPVPGIEITLSSDCSPLELERGLNRSTQTASDGTFRFDNLPYRIFCISTFPLGWAPAGALFVRPQKGPGRTVDFGLTILDPIETTRMGVHGVVKSSKGKPAADAKVILECILNPVLRYETRTDERGEYSIDLASFWNGPAGHYYVTAFKQGVGLAVQTVTFLRDKEVFEVNLRLKPVRQY